MCGALRVVPVEGETAWSFLYRVAAAYRCRSPISRHRGGGRTRCSAGMVGVRTARCCSTGWRRSNWPGGAVYRHGIWRGRCRRGPPGLKRWPAGAGTRRGGHGGWGLECRPVAFLCRLCAARRSGGRVWVWVWVYRPQQALQEAHLVQGTPPHHQTFSTSRKSGRRCRVTSVNRCGGMVLVSCPRWCERLPPALAPRRLLQQVRLRAAGRP